MKRIAPLAAALVLTGALTGCGSDEEKEATPIPANPSASSQTYTTAQVKEHKDEKSCWTIIDGKVYDVTQWINQHPGGPDKIKGLCGEDGTAQFKDQHSGDQEPQSRLASFQIGTLAG